jgi:glucose/arabinose dehydrogenase
VKRYLTLAITLLGVLGLPVAVTVLDAQDAPSAVAAPAFSQADVIDEFVAGGNWQGVVAADWMPDGRMLAVKKTGAVYLINPQTGTSTVHFTVPGILATGELGMLDIAVAPDFATTKQVYVYSSNAADRRLQIDRFTYSETGSTMLASRTPIWKNPGSAIVADYHIGGSLIFGPDGMIYLSVGDNTTSSNSQSLVNVFGKVLRLARDGSVPAGNPFADGAGPNVDEIWARGLRNPFRGEFDAVTGNYWMADVGGNTDATAYEEVDIIQPGKHYGWPSCEGPLSQPKNGPICPSGTEGPVYSYTHNIGGGCCMNKAIVGGEVYRGNSFPAAFKGSYVYADYPTGTFYWLEKPVSGAVSGVLKTSTLGSANPVWLEVSPIDGYIYWLHFGWANNGQLRRLRYAGALAHPPVITESSATNVSGPAPLNVAFNGAATDSDGDVVTYLWEFGDGTTSTVATPNHVYSANGLYDARLTVASGGDVIAGPPIRIQVGAPPAPVIDPPASTVFSAGETISLTGHATDGTGAPVPPSSLEWTVVFKHNGHQHPGVTSTGATLTMPVSTSGHGWEGDTGFEVTLRATDAAGLTATSALSLTPRKVTLPLTSSVPGSTVLVDGVAHLLPFNVDTIVGFNHEISAAAVACDGTTSYTFQGWSTGETTSLNYVVPPAPAPIEGDYVADGTCQPTLYRAINLNGPALTIDGVDFEAGDTAQNVASGPNRFCDNVMPLVVPPVSATEEAMIRCSVWGTATNGAAITVGSVPNTTYNVTLWIWEDNIPQVFDLAINGVVVVPGQGSGPAGTWAKLGPYPVTVTNGQISINASGGDANISGVRIDTVPGGVLPPPPPPPPPTLPPVPTTLPPIPTTLPPVTTVPATVAPAATGAVKISRSTTRTPSFDLNGSTLTSGEQVYVFLDSPEPASSVRFFVDQPVTGAAQRVELTAPWDLAGGSITAAFPYTANLTVGDHVIRALLTRPNGTSAVFESTFAVTSAAPPPTTAAPVVTTAAPVVTTAAPVVTTPAPVVTTAAPVATTSAPAATTLVPAGVSGSLKVSRAANRTTPTALAGAAFARNERVYIFLDTSQGAVSVRFFLDAPTTGTAARVEALAPWDYAGGSVLVATPFTANLTAGPHTIRALLTRPNGTTETFEAAFVQL